MWKCLSRIEQKLDRVLHLLTASGHAETEILVTLESLVADLNNETNAVAAKIDKLGAELTTAVSSGQAPKPETLAALSAISDRLKSLGADPNAPIPNASNDIGQGPSAA